MITFKIIKPSLFLSIILIASCASNGRNTSEFAHAAGEENADLYANACKIIECNYDSLEGQLEVVGVDRNPTLIDRLSGSFPHNLEFTWISGSPMIRVDAIYASTDGWMFLEEARIYSGKTIVATLNNLHSREIGYYNESVQSHETIERMTGVLSINEAASIAATEPGQLTIRFVGRDGYRDRAINDTKQLAAVVQIAATGTSSR